MRALACLQPEEALRISKFRFLDDAKLSLVRQSDVPSSSLCCMADLVSPATTPTLDCLYLAKP